MSDDPEWLEGIVEDEGVALAPPTGRQLSEAEKKHLALRSIEDNMLQSSMEVVNGVLNFADIEMDADGKPIKPDGWTDKQFRIGLSGMMSAKEAPVAIKIAVQTAGNIIKARATEKGGGRTLNVVQVKFTMPREKYETIDVDE